MTVTGDAGRSASARAEELRRQAAEREQRARNYEQGAIGERLTAEALARSGDPGWHVFNDVWLPGRQANIDHLVVTPAGVFVIDSKHWSTSPHEGGGTLWTGRWPKRSELATLSGSVTAVRHILQGGSAPVRAVLSLTSAPPAQRLLRAGEVETVGVDDLVAYLRAQPPVLGPSDVAVIADRVSAAHAAAHHPPAQPTPPRWAASAAQRPPRTRPALAPPAPLPWRQPHQGRSRRKRSPLLRLLPPVIVLFGGLIAILMIDAFAHTMQHKILASLPTTTTPATVPLTVKWSCPAPAQGWTATIVWPAGTTEPPNWEIQTASASTGPWTMRMGFSTSAATVTHLHPNLPVWVRAGSAWSMPETGHAITAGELVPPAGC